MLNVEIPGRGALRILYVLSDYNGTLACDGRLIPQLRPLIERLSRVVEVHVITADTFGSASRNLENLRVKLSILPADNQDQRKATYLADLGPGGTVALGNGRNDRLMLRNAALGIAIIEAEGTCIETFQAADIVCRSPLDAVNLLLNPKRLVATLRT